MFKIPRITALQDNTSSRNFAHEVINEQGCCEACFFIAELLRVAEHPES